MYFMLYLFGEKVTSCSQLLNPLILIVPFSLHHTTVCSYEDAFAYFTASAIVKTTAKLRKSFKVLKCFLPEVCSCFATGDNMKTQHILSTSQFMIITAF